MKERVKLAWHETETQRKKSENGGGAGAPINVEFSHLICLNHKIPIHSESKLEALEGLNRSTLTGR